VKHLIGQAAAEVLLPRILSTRLEVSEQHEGIHLHLRHAKQHMEVPYLSKVTLTCVFKAKALMTFGIVHVDAVKGITVQHVDVVMVEVC
jgi:hypothetical protein